MSISPADSGSLRRRLATLSIIADLNLALSSTLDLGTVRNMLFEAIIQVTGAQRCVLLLVDSLPLRCQICIPEEQFALVEGDPIPACPAHQVLAGNGPLVLVPSDEDDQRVVRCRAAPEGYSSYIGVPLVVGGEVIGVIEAIEIAAPEFSDQQAALLAAMSAPAALAISNARLYQQVLEEKQHVEQLETQVRQLFRTYLPPPVADLLVTQPDQAQPGGERKEVTVLFADLEGFTGLAESSSPEEVIQTLNSALTIMIETVQKYGGIPAAFTGDGIMAVFNAPVTQEDHPWLAVQAALEIRDHIARSNLSLRVNMGLDMGAAIVGNIGSQQLLNYTAIGDAVNVASRLQDMAHGGHILISEAIYEHVRKRVRAESLGEQKIAGRQAPVKTYAVTGRL